MHSDFNRNNLADDERDKAAFLAELLDPPGSTLAAAQRDGTPGNRAATSGVEAVLLDIWRDTFNDGVALDDNYFALGGDSLTSIRISARARRAGLDIAMQDIIVHPTVRTLAAYLAARPADAGAPEIHVAPERDALGFTYPSTAAQEGMLFQCLAAPNDALYVSQFSCVLTGPLEPARFEAALRLLVRRHPALRTAFPNRLLARHRQLIHDEVVFDYRFDATPSSTDAAALDALDALARSERERPFDFGCPPLLRVRLVALADGRHAWIWTQHHLVADGRAQECLMVELADLYRRLEDDANLEVVEDPSYRDALVDVHATREPGQHFWTDYLAHFDASPPCGREASRATGASAPAELSIDMTDAEADALSAAFADAQLTAGSALAAWFALAMCMTFERRDLLVGVVTSGRHGPRARYGDTVGNLISTVPLRATLNRGRTLRQWTRGMQRSVADLQRREQTSLQDIKRWIGWPAALPLFDAIFVHENYGAPDVLFGDAIGLRIERSRFHVNEGHPLVLVCEEGARMRLTLRYQPDACPDDVARALLDRLVRVRAAWMADAAHDVLDLVSELR
ncbi:hypothetical protein WL02_31055 [Burkholderia ubonensis]|uniref:condensation domain-containing protein n=1 Tax=Burkholderia ubonensis TaxID=101571 RepID=UPI00076BDCBD|nr:condensation domain-containing protein [Burkholderia ubonensis]KVX25314.1 hypothetical protein WL02_31055 [Burkholderia ubonensis]